MLETGTPINMEHELKGIRELSIKYERLNTLINRVDAASLLMAHDKQSRKKAMGVDKVTKDQYAQNLIGNIKDLIGRMKRFEYVPQPVRRTYIPKANGKLRPLGIPSYEDRLVQAVMADILKDIYEPRFLDCSYGFRENRSAHDVVRRIDRAVMREGVNYVLEADIKGFFDNLDQGWLMKFLAHDIADRNFLRYIKRFLKAGIMDGNERLESDRGCPQGGLISPVLANVYLHYVLDLWMERRVKKQLRGKMLYLRFADDFVCLFQYRDDAITVMQWLKARLEKFKLEVAEEKTRILPFGRYCGTKEKFDFLGFTFLNAETREGRYRLAVITSSKKLKAKRLAVKQWIRTRINKPMVETWRLINLALRGHYNYYGVNGNMRAMTKFVWYVWHLTLKMLKRRSQNSKITVEKFSKLWDLFVAPPRITTCIWGR